MYPCKNEEIVSELIQLGLDPDIKTNKGLLDNFKIVYGDEIHSYLIKNHPFLEENPDANIDRETLFWAIEAIWDPSNSVARHMIIALDLSNETVLQEYTEMAMDSLLNSSEKTKLTFKNNEEYIFFKDKSEAMIRKILNEGASHVSDEQVNIIKNAFSKNYFNVGGYTIGLKNVIYKNPVIIIEGHGAADDTEIMIGNVTITSIELVNILKELKLPSDSTIKLDSCFSGCTKEIIEKTREEIKKIFERGQLTSHSGPVNGSFLHDFSKEIYKAMPSFTGDVEGYIGMIETVPKKNVHRQNGSIMPKGNASEVQGLDGSILLKKEEVRVTIKRSDIFPKSNKQG